MKIGELADAAQCTTETIRFYEKEGLLPVARRTAGNYRAYTQAHAERLLLIRNCRALDMTHEEIRNLLAVADAQGAQCGAIDKLVEEHTRHVDERIVELAALKLQLVALRARCDSEKDAADCGIVDALSTTRTAPKKPKGSHLG